MQTPKHAVIDPQPVIRQVITALYDPAPEEELSVRAAPNSFEVTDYQGTVQPINLSALQRACAQCLTSGHLRLEGDVIVTVSQYQADPLRYQDALRETLKRDPRLRASLRAMIRALRECGQVYVRGE